MVNRRGRSPIRQATSPGRSLKSDTRFWPAVRCVRKVAGAVFLPGPYGPARPTGVRFSRMGLLPRCFLDGFRGSSRGQKGPSSLGFWSVWRRGTLIL